MFIYKQPDVCFQTSEKLEKTKGDTRFTKEAVKRAAIRLDDYLSSDAPRFAFYKKASESNLKFDSLARILLTVEPVFITV